MQARMSNPAMIVPGALKAMDALAKLTRAVSHPGRVTLSTCAQARSMAVASVLTYTHAK